MVRLSNSGKLRKDSEAASGTGKVAVKLEVEDPVEEECGPLSKRSRPSAPFRQELQHQWSMDGGTASSHQPVQYNPLDEPSPLGLRLRKSPSLLELIQMKLSLPSAASSCITGGDGADGGKKKDTKSTGVSGSTDKLKASNFPASLLRIGSWECVSRYEGDLVAKCYFAKHKLVWEVLDGGLKSKIEIQWSDITALKASCPDNGPGTLDIVLARQPLFFRETNPQPRKHTLWQATSDFTGGQASIHKRHFLQCPPVLLSKHFEKLIQCDPRLNSLSWQQDIVLDSPFFEPKCPGYDDLEETKCRGFDCRKGDDAPSFSSFRDASSTCSAPSTSSKSEIRDQIGRTPDSSSRETPSPISGFDTRDVEEITSFQVEELKDPSGWDQFKVPGLHPSMSMSDLVNHIGNCISEKMAHGIFPDTSPMNKDMLEEITQHLLGDAQTGATAASDENSLMSRVNSLCCLLNPATNQSLQTIKDGTNKDADGSDDEREPTPERKPMFESSSVEGDSHEHKSAPSIARKESVGDLLLHLPRIASLPQFLFNVSEDRESHAR